jgi:phenazine biosynthesis protein phzE
MTDLAQLMVPEAPPFALLYRPESLHSRKIEVLTGIPVHAHAIDDLPSDDLLVVLPYQQIAERGYAFRPDDAGLLGMAVRDTRVVDFEQFMREVPDTVTEISGGHFDVSDDEYADIVRSVVREEIGTGEGSNFVIKRSFLATIDNFSPAVACALFRRLLQRETGAYWTFLARLGERTFVGASPERHITVSGGVATMNPISGTYRYPPGGPDRAELLNFLGDAKEADELCMVLDEELKMMAAICQHGGRVVGPQLREMAHLAHTEYFIRGRTNLDVREILKKTLFAPTVTGSPLESACRAICRHEPKGRGYYGGAIALITRDSADRPTLDSAILIRTAEIDPAGALAIGVGATLVRHSDPESEAAETKVKAAALLGALAGDAQAPAYRPQLGGDPDVRRALLRKNTTLAPFWLAAAELDVVEPQLVGRRILILDAEDAFTEMLAHQLRALGAKVEVNRFDEPAIPESFDLVVIGPGPGDPRDVENPKMAALRRTTQSLLSGGHPFLAVCLGHQILSGLLGLRLVRKRVPRQGTQREIDLFGARVRVGFYNTFSAISMQTALRSDLVAQPVEVCRDPATNDVYALRGPGFRSFQFHLESVLSVDGLSIIREASVALLPVLATRSTV